MSNSTLSSGTREKFSGRLGYLMATAGSAVGLGNIWRFPYLVAQYGGGIFILVYLLLIVIFGYSLVVTETALGRKTGKSPIAAFGTFGKKPWMKAGAWINAIVPAIIVPYYCAIGGWVVKYLVEYIKGNSSLLATDAYFGSFISNSVSSEICFAVFTLATFFFVVFGVKKGIETGSKIMMPLLIVLAVIIAVYSVTRPGAIEGVKYMFIPNFKNFSAMTLVAAMGQMFYSMSLAMGILITYGSYIDKDVDIEKSSIQLGAFDTGIALLAGLMIIPAVFAFSGGSAEALNSGPSLMFVTIPKVFESMGFGNVIGAVFFIMVLFAAITSSISLMETCVATLVDQFKWSRLRCCIVVFVYMLIVGTASVLGYGPWKLVTIFGMQILDFFDFLSNSLMMPIAALFTCLFITRIVGLNKIEDEVLQSSSFKLQKLYRISIKYIAPVILVIILISSIASVLGIIKM